MKTYKHILLALELVPESDKLIIEKARELIAKSKAHLSLIHSVEHYANFGSAYSIAGGMDIEEELLKGAQSVLATVAKELHVPTDRQIIKLGSAKHLIVDEAKKMGADLIVVGSHGRHGVRLLLGSTANAVIHAAHCDVLAVRVK